MNKLKLVDYFQEIKASWCKEDTLILSSSAAAVMLFFMIIAFTPVGDGIKLNFAKKLNSGEIMNEPVGRNGEIQDKGLFRVGRMIASLGARDEYLDTDIDIEYDLGIMQLNSQGEINNLKRANKFCESKKHKIKDAFISVLADTSVKEIKEHDGIYNLKSSLLDAVNQRFASDRQLFTNIFFNKFTLLPAEG